MFCPVDIPGGVLAHIGMFSLLAHIRIRKIAGVLEAKTAVLPAVDKEAECLFSRSKRGSRVCEGGVHVLLVSCHTCIMSSAVTVQHRSSKHYYISKSGVVLCVQTCLLPQGC